MSFGVGVGDVYTLCKLIKRTHNGWRDACGEYASFTSDLAILESVVGRVEAEVSSPGSDILKHPEDAEGWNAVSGRCTAVVSELQDVLASYDSLSKSRRRNWDGIRQGWDKLRFGTKNCDDLRKDLTRATAGLTAYVSVIGLGSQFRIEHSIFPEIIQRIDGLAEQLRKGNSTIRSVRTVNSDDDADIWREFRRDLIRSGIRGADIQRYSAALKTHLLRLKREGMLDEEVPQSDEHPIPQLSPSTLTPRATSYPAAESGEEGRRPLTNTTEQIHTEGRASTTSPPKPNDFKNYISPFVEDASDDELDGLPDADNDLMINTHIPEDSDTLTNAQDTQNDNSHGPHPAGISSADTGSQKSADIVDINSDIERSIETPATRHENKRKLGKSEPPYDPKLNSCAADSRPNFQDTIVEQSERNEPHGNTVPIDVSRLRRRYPTRRLLTKKTEIKVPKAKPDDSPKKKPRETAQRSDAAKERTSKPSSTAYTFVPPPSTAKLQPNAGVTAGKAAADLGVKSDTRGTAPGKGGFTPHQQQSTNAEDLFAQFFSSPESRGSNHVSNIGGKAAADLGAKSDTKETPGKAGSKPHAQQSLNAEDLFAQFFSSPESRVQGGSKSNRSPPVPPPMAGSRSPRPPPSKSSAPPPKSPAGPWSAPAGQVPQPKGATPAKGPVSGPSTTPAATAAAPGLASKGHALRAIERPAIEWHQLDREKLHPPIDCTKATELPEGWDYRLDERNRVFFVDTYARCAEKHCFWLPPVREQPDLVSRRLGWRRVYNVFGRIHWVHDASGTVSYARPDKQNGLHCYNGGEFTAWDPVLGMYRPWRNLVREGKKIIIDDTNTACQIQAAVWDRGISDDAIKVRGDLWWGASDVKETNLKVTRQHPDGSTYTVNVNPVV